MVRIALDPQIADLRSPVVSVLKVGLGLDPRRLGTVVPHQQHRRVHLIIHILRSYEEAGIKLILRIGPIVEWSRPWCPLSIFMIQCVEVKHLSAYERVLARIQEIQAQWPIKSDHIADLVIVSGDKHICRCHLGRIEVLLELVERLYPQHRIGNLPDQAANTIKFSIDGKPGDFHSFEDTVES